MFRGLKKLNFKFILLVSFIVLSSVFTGLFFNSIINAEDSDKEKIDNSPEDIVYSYIQFISGEKFNDYKKLFSDAKPGRDPVQLDNPDPNSYMDVPDAEKQGIIGYKSKNQSAILDNVTDKLLNNQKSFVTSLFGVDAWENVEYELVKVDCPITIDQCIDKKTGKIISEEERFNLNKEFWDNVILIEGLDSIEFYEYPNNVQQIGEEKAERIQRVKAKYRKSVPAETRPIPLYETYKVKIKFNNIINASSGEYDFHIIVINENGKWKLYAGLQWMTPAPSDPEFDV